MSEPQNITWHEGEISRADRERIRGHKGVTLWLTGLSASGKSTIARRVEQLLVQRGCAAYVLDGDNVRHGLNKDLGFSPEARTENIRRIGEVAKLFTDTGMITLTAFISPYRADRDSVRAIMAPEDFIEVFVSAPLSVCEARDPKGLYQKARTGALKEFTGISAPYEAPDSAELTLHTDQKPLDACAEEVIGFLITRGILPNI